MSTETNQQELAGLTGTASAMIAGAAESLEQVFGVPVDLKLASINDGTAAAEESLRFATEFGGAATGQSWLVLAKSDAATVVKATPQSAGLPDDDLLGESGMSALSGAIDLMVAGAATAISNELGDLVDISPPSFSPDTETTGDPVIAVFDGVIGENAAFKITWEFDPDLAAGLGARWLATHDEPAPVESAAPPEPAVAAPAPAAPAVAALAPAAPAVGAPAVGGGVINTVELDVAVELGNVAVTIGDLLRMGEGSVVTLTQAVGDNVTMLANGTPVANGEVVVVDGTLGFRVADLITEPKGA